MDFISRSDFDVDNFMRVSASLVRKLGSANDALVLARVVFRCALSTSYTHRLEGHTWWATTKDDVAVETGLSVAQVKHSLGRLIDAGLVVAEEHRLGGSTDRTKSYRPQFPHDKPSQHPNSHPSPFERSPVAALTFYQEDKKKGYTATPNAVASKPMANGLARITQGFDKAWESWPKKVDRKDAEKRFREAIRKVPLDEMVEFIAVHGHAYSQHRDKVYTPGLATWLHRERWTDELVTPEPARNGAVRQPAGLTPTARAREIIDRATALDEAQSANTAMMRELEELNL